ncbi:hypothetical protein H310_07800 [Aphanomyces invadans]|uniref:Secreted protein n=1 Tax=Aphanomyces invadans TaxID=157072 RepID=A0A024U1H2_9STRA|nr:hypothetical protein H310_07800 [Aphanomyces invadans]ETV99746.1 hypothetical protein H310_07800 [Aphanomyces invadans]|eukprot:XP_008871522.1 hypothetical protein H310_07800 [Aphanomyces invadans]
MHTVSLLVAVLAAARTDPSLAVPCSSSVYLTDVNALLKTCEAALPAGTTPATFVKSNTSQYCSIPSCRSYEDAVSALPCEPKNRTSPSTKSVCSTTSAAPPVDDSRPCSTSVLQARAPLKAKCRQVFGSRNVTTQEDLEQYCAVDACAANVKQYANLTCTVGDVPASIYATLCDSTHAQPYVPPAIPCGDDVRKARAALKLRCEQVSGFPSLMNATSLVDLEAYCAYPECKANVRQYVNLTCAIDGYASSLYATMCDDLTRPNSGGVPVCSADVTNARAALQLTCQQATGGLTPLNLTTVATRSVFCENAACAGYLKQFTDVTNCSIYGAPASVWSTVCDRVVKPPYLTTGVPTTGSQSAAECTLGAFQYGFEAASSRCTTAAGIATLLPNSTTSAMSMASLAKLCPIPECATAFLLFTDAKCTIQGVPASVIAKLCAPASRPTATSAPSVAGSVSVLSVAVATVVVVVWNL